MTTLPDAHPLQYALPPLAQANIAFVHEKLADAFTGSEMVFFKALERFPQADVYSLFVDRQILPKALKNLPIETTFLQDWPWLHKRYKWALPLMPLAMESLDLQAYDVIFSSHHCMAKSLIPRPDAYHVSYCHSPARYIWDMYWTYTDDSTSGLNPLTSFLYALTSHYLRLVDVSSANRVSVFLANSRFTAQRILQYYNREAHVVFPPVDTQRFAAKDSQGYTLMVGRLVGYKGFDLAVETFNQLPNQRLKIIGDGPDAERLRAKANANIEFLGRVSDLALAEAMSHCHAFLFPGVEDFGIVMAEAQAAGKPVLAFNAGGARDIVRHGETGLLFDAPTTEALKAAIQYSHQHAWDSHAIQAHAQQFDTQVFQDRVAEILAHPHRL